MFSIVFDGDSWIYNHQVCKKNILGCCSWGNRCCFVHLRRDIRTNNENFLRGSWKGVNGMVIKIEGNRIESNN